MKGVGRLVAVLAALASSNAHAAIELSAISAVWAGRYTFNDQAGAQVDLSSESIRWVRLQGGLTVGWRDRYPIAALDLNIGPSWKFLSPFVLLGGTFTVFRAWSGTLNVGAGLRIGVTRSLFVSPEVSTLLLSNSGVAYGAGIGWAL